MKGGPSIALLEFMKEPRARHAIHSSSKLLKWVDGYKLGYWWPIDHCNCCLLRLNEPANQIAELFIKQSTSIINPHTTEQYRVETRICTNGLRRWVCVISKEMHESRTSKNGAISSSTVDTADSESCSSILVRCSPLPDLWEGGRERTSIGVHVIE